MVLQKTDRKMVDAFAERSIGDRDREKEGADSRQRSLRVLSPIVRRMNRSVGEKSADSEQRGCRPAVGEVACMPGKRDAQDRNNSQQPRLACNLEMHHRDRAEMTLHHQQHANGSRFDSLVAAKRQPELVPFVEYALQVHKPTLQRPTRSRLAR